MTNVSRRVKKDKKLRKDQVEGTPEIDNSIYDHLRPENQAKLKSTKPIASSGFNATLVAFLGVIIIGGLVVGGFFSSEVNLPGTNNDQNNQDGIPIIDNNNDVTDIADVCLNIGQHTGINHYHFTLNIFNLAGNQITIPSDTGITDTCMSGMHTHDPDNKIHVEYGDDYRGDRPSVGDFFRIWGQQLTDTQLMGDTGAVTLTVNGSTLGGSPGTYGPFDGDVVTLTIS